MESLFDSISELSPTSAAKWHEVFETLFENYEYSQKILTTKGYGKADLTNRKVTWQLFKLKGDFNILNASATLMYDSGAQRTVLCELGLSQNSRECEEVYYAANNSLSTGTLLGELCLSGQGIEILLKEVLYSPEIDYNLISTWDIARAGYEVCHDTDDMWITSKLTGQKFLIANSPGDHLFWGSTDLEPTQPENVYDFGSNLQTNVANWLNAQQFAIIANINKQYIPDPFGPKTLAFYHLACGHASLAALKSLRKLNIILFRDNPDDEAFIKSCQICNEINLVAKPHNKKHVPAQRKHERVHSDTMGPILGKRGRTLYVTTLTDEHTRYTELVITETKSFKDELMSKLKVWQNRYPQHPIRFFRSDNASEMPTSEELAALGIEKELIVSYSPQQNGFAEAINKILISKVKKIIFPFRTRNYLPLLKFIFDFAAHSANHLPPRNRETIPQIAYHGTTVDDNSYHMFGVDVIVKLNSAQEARTAEAMYHKFNNTVRGSFIGYHGPTGYKVLVNSTKVITTKDVKFCAEMKHLMEYFENVDNMRLENIHPDKDAFEQLENSLKVKEHIWKYPTKVLEAPLTDYEEEIDAIEDAPLTMEIEESYRNGYAVVANQPNLITTVERPDEQTSTKTPMMLPPGCAYQSPTTEDCRQASEVGFEKTRDTLTVGIQATSSLGVESSKAGTNRDTGERVTESNQTVPDSVCERGENLEREPSVHEDEGNTSHSSLVLNSSGLNEQDDGNDHSGVTPIEIDEISPESSHQYGIVQEEGEPLFGESEGTASGVHCDVFMSVPLFPDGKSVKLPSTLEPTQEVGSNQRGSTLLSTEHELSVSGGENAEQASSTTDPTHEVESNQRGSNLLNEKPVPEGGLYYRDKSGRLARKSVNSIGISPRKSVHFIDRHVKNVMAHAKKMVNHIQKKHPDLRAWKQAEKDEIDKFILMGVYEVRTKPQDITAIPTRFVYTYKEDDLKGNQYKARCVVQGFRQLEGVHFDKFRVLSPVTDTLSIRCLALIATEYNYPVHHLDIKLAYLNAPLPKGEEIYVVPPPGFEVEGKHWFLKKSVYGMKQSGFEWYMFLAHKLVQLGLKPNEMEETVFTRQSKTGYLIVALYVDDLFLVAENEGVLEEFKIQLESMFDLKYFGLVSEYLGIVFRRTETGYSMSQVKFLRELISEFEQHGITPRQTPLQVEYKGSGSSTNPKEDAFVELTVDDTKLLVAHMKTKYQSGVGSVNWAANNTRPDLSVAGSTLASKSSNPTRRDFKKLLHCLGYILWSIEQELEYSRQRRTGPIGEFVIETFSDASFAPGPDAKLISGMAMYVNRNLVKWLSKKQNNITRSTAAAELVALSIAEDRTVHLKDLITSLGYKVNATKLYEDNQAVIACCQKKSISHTRKMVDIKMKIIRERLIEKFYTLEYVPSMLNVADMFTKALPVGTYRRLVAQLFMQPEAGAKE